MSRDTAASFFISSPFLGKAAELYQVLRRNIESYHQLSNRLIQLAEQAHAFRQFDKVKEYGQVLSHIPVKDYQGIGHYFLGVATHRRAVGNENATRRLLEQAVDTAPDAYKLQALLSLSALSFRKRDFDSTLYYFHQTLKAKKLGIAGLQAIKGISILKAIEGSHAQAVKDLESILPMMRYAPAHIYYDLLNSYAVELGEVGRKDEARNVMQIVLASPFIFAYPEWRETAEELKPASRSSVIIESATSLSRNVLFMPVEHERRPNSAERSPAPVLNFQKWKAKMLKGDKDQNKKSRMNEKDMLIRLMEIFTDNATTYEQKRKILEAAEQIISEPSTPDTDEPVS